MRFITLIIALLAALFITFGFPHNVTAAENTPVVKVTAVTPYTHNGVSGNKVILAINGETVTMFAPIKPFDVGNNTPIVGVVGSFADQTCFPIFGCAGYATFTQTVNKTTVRIAAYRF